MANLIKTQLDGDLLIEYSNECWNLGFDQTGYCTDQGLLESPAITRHEWYGLRSVECFALFEAEFGNRDRFKRIISHQHQAINDQ